MIFNAGSDMSRVSVIGASEVSRWERQLVTDLAVVDDSKVIASMVFNA